MLPSKIKTKLLREFGVAFYQFPPRSVIQYLTKFDTEENINEAINTSMEDITKIQFNHPDGKIDTIFDRTINIKKIIDRIRNDSSMNYHDYLTTFKFKKDHEIYDLIVEVNYRYVYS